MLNNVLFLFELRITKPDVVNSIAKLRFECTYSKMVLSFDDADKSQTYRN